MLSGAAFIAFLAIFPIITTAQTYCRLGACPNLGCILPPDQSEFLAGQYFDLRVEVHAPVNGSQARDNNGEPDKDFKVTIRSLDSGGSEETNFAGFFKIEEEPEVEEWSFGYWEDLFAEDRDRVTGVNVASKAYRRLNLREPGRYEVKLEYYGGEVETAVWTVRPLAEVKKAKNIVVFIGDGMTTNMITAARLIGHRSINGKYQSRLALDEFPVLGHQMTHSLDSFITDSSNSASALYTGHKTSVGAAGVYADSSPDPFDDPKIETIVELIVRNWGSAWGAVSTAHLGDSTPTALTAHCRDRQHGPVLVEQALFGISDNYTWTSTNGPDVYFGGGAEYFYPHLKSYKSQDQFARLQPAPQGSYAVALNKTSLLNLPNDQHALGVFSQGDMPVWLDRNVFTDSLEGRANSPLGTADSATDLPGLKDMTLKAIEILHQRGRLRKTTAEDDEKTQADDVWDNRGFFLMSEAASIDKQMHEMDYDRALGDLLELDDTLRATVKKLEELEILNETLLLVTADHGHGFDVFGSADTKYLEAQTDDRSKRRAIGVYASSGLSNYLDPEAEKSMPYGNASLPVPNADEHFPTNWTPRYALAAGFVASPDRRENHIAQPKPVSRASAAEPPHTSPSTFAPSASSSTEKVTAEYYANPESAPSGYYLNGNLNPRRENRGVHSLTDVPVFARGPCQDKFAGVYDNTEVFFRMAECFGLGRGDERLEGKRWSVEKKKSEKKSEKWDVKDKPPFHIRGTDYEDH